MAHTALAPVVLLLGFVAGARAQPAGYSSVNDTISELAATTARDRWLMTGALVVAGLVVLGSAVLLTRAAPAGRLLLGIGGIAILLVAANPLPSGGNTHTWSAYLAFLSLSVWPAAAVRRSSGVAALQPRAGVPMTVLCLLLLTLYGIAPFGCLGTFERLLALACVSWPCAVAVGGLRSRR